MISLLFSFLGNQLLTPTRLGSCINWCGVCMKKRTSTYDVRIWVRELYECGYTVFLYSELPDELKQYAYLRKASTRGFIRALEVMQNDTVVWIIVRW